VNKVNPVSRLFMTPLTVHRSGELAHQGIPKIVVSNQYATSTLIAMLRMRMSFFFISVLGFGWWYTIHHPPEVIVVIVRYDLHVAIHTDNEKSDFVICLHRT